MEGRILTHGRREDIVGDETRVSMERADDAERSGLREVPFLFHNDERRGLYEVPVENDAYDVKSGRKPGRVERFVIFAREPVSLEGLYGRVCRTL